MWSKNSKAHLLICERNTCKTKRIESTGSFKTQIQYSSNLICGISSDSYLIWRFPAATQTPAALWARSDRKHSGPDPLPLRVLRRRGLWFKGGTSSHQCWTTAVERRPGGADEGNVRQVDCTTWNHFWWFLFDLDDRSCFKRKKKKNFRRHSMNFSTNKNDEKKTNKDVEDKTCVFILLTQAQVERLTVVF